MSEDSTVSPPRSRPQAVQRRILLAQAALAWEDLLPRLWRSAALIAGFVGITLLGLWLWLPGWLHVIILAGFVVFCHFSCGATCRDGGFPARPTPCAVWS